MNLTLFLPVQFILYNILPYVTLLYLHYSNFKHDSEYIYNENKAKFDTHLQTRQSVLSHHSISSSSEQQSERLMMPYGSQSDEEHSPNTMQSRRSTLMMKSSLTQMMKDQNHVTAQLISKSREMSFERERNQKNYDVTTSKDIFDISIACDKKDTSYTNNSQVVGVEKDRSKSKSRNSIQVPNLVSESMVLAKEKTRHTLLHSNATDKDDKRNNNEAGPHRDDLSALLATTD